VGAEFIYPTPQDLVADLEKLVWHQEEPFGSTSIFAQWSVFKLVHANKVKVMLDGQGADEMLAGYVYLFESYFHQLLKQRKFLTLGYEAHKYTMLHQKPWMPILKKGLAGMWGNRGYLSSAVGSGPNWLNPVLANKYPGPSLYHKTKAVKPFGERQVLENTLYRQTFLSHLQPLLRHEDRNSMAFSVEARVPFLDHSLVEFVFSLPSRFKIRDGYTKRVLRDGMRGVIPEKIRWRVKKLGFATPERKWQQTVLKPLIEAAIRDERLRPYVVATQAADYFTQVQQQEATDSAPWRWLNLSLWMNAYELG
jgi:asparagine synthase (glutamine-hydrolysing)